MTVHWFLVAQWAVLIGGVILTPPIVRRLPEPPPVVLPEAGSPEESELDRMLRAEGPTETYRDMADHLRRGWWPIWPLIVLSGLSGLIDPPRLAWVALALTPVVALLVVVDWRRKLLPRIVVRPLTVVLILLMLIDWTVRRDTDALVREACGGVLAWTIFGLLWFVRRAGMGLGDVRLALPIGILTAALSWNAWLIGLYAGFVGFAAFGVGLLLIRRDRGILKRAYPFGPFMIAGAYAGMALAPHLHLIG
jgi:leader peptidase (prepilin peptidase)/N-methyltransferase